MARGYDHLRVNMDLVLDLPFREGDDLLVAFRTLDYAKPHHIVLGSDGLPWSALSNDLMTLDWDAAAFNSVSCDPPLDLAFTTENFSGALWIKPHAYGISYLIDNDDDPGVDGYGFYLRAASPYLAFETRQAGPTLQTTQGGPTLALNVWQFVGFTRAGAVAHIYLNGVDVTTVSAVHVDPDASPGPFVIAADGSTWLLCYDGGMWRPRVWKRALTASQMVAMFEMERKFFGV